VRLGIELSLARKFSCQRDRIGNASREREIDASFTALVENRISDLLLGTDVLLKKAR
jgi:hypothetical protein